MPNEISPSPGEALREDEGVFAKYRATREAKRSERDAKRNREAKPRSIPAAKPAPASEAKFRIAASPPLVALFIVVSLIAAFAYGISAWQVYGFAQNVWGLPFELRFAAAVIADLLSLAGLFATYLLRTAKVSVRAYAWVVFLLMTGLSIAAAESFAHWRTLSPMEQAIATHKGGLPAQVASGAVVVSLALAVHLLIIVRRHAPLPSESVAPVPPEKPQVKAAPIAPPAPIVPPAEPKRIARPKSPTPVPPRASATHSEAADRVIAEKATAKEVATELGVSPRAVQLWVQARRKELAAKPQVNGHVFVPTEQGVN
jgi:hypothetical protein